MRTGFLFQCTYQAPREFPQLRILEVRRGSLKLFSLPPRKTTGIQVLSMMGLILPFIGCLGALSVLLESLSPSWRYIELIAVPFFILWLTKVPQWSIEVAFRYSKGRSDVGMDVQPGEVKFGFLTQRLHVLVEGKQVVLSMGCRRQTLISALQLGAHK